MRAILVDFNGTISTDKFWRSLPPAQLDRIQNYLFGTNSDLVKSWMRGQIATQDIALSISQATNIDCGLLLSTLKADCETMFVDPDIICQLKLLRSRFQVHLVTANMDCFNQTVKALSLYNSFDDIINSAEIALLKTDNCFFDWFSNRYNIPLSECALLDDDVSVGIEFTQRGGRYFRVRNPAETLAHLKNIYAAHF
jgi:FMN phosphatase YigB (HAD superfamily)